MAIFELFSKRQKKLRGDVPDVYVYDEIPQPLKVQIVNIWEDTLGNSENYYSYREDVKGTYKFLVETICREYGLFKLPTAEKYGDRMYFSELANFLLQSKSIDENLDVIELTFKAIDRLTRNYNYLGRHEFDKAADDGIKELNIRFKEHGIGYQFVEGEIIRVDSELIHVEAVKPALRLLNQKNYHGAQEEFLSAYEHYRHGNFKESLNDCLKSFESTMKAICDKRDWKYANNATSRALIQVCFDNGLIPTFWQQQLTSLRSLLESSIPTGRNKLSGHGQGNEIITIPDHLVAYMLHMTASTLVFLATAEEKIA
ncbi:STM4504/CBY_0614 family protein [Vibrio vulnificus]